jgi:serine/threonine protein kinase
MAPEQLLGETANARSDQFSFCVTAYEALYGEHPFGEGDLKEKTSAMVAGRVKEPPRGARVPSWLRRVLLRGLSANPDERHGSMAELISRLTNDPSLVWRRRAVGALVALALATTGAVSYRLLSGDEPDACGGAQQRLAGIWDSWHKGGTCKRSRPTGRPWPRGRRRSARVTPR